MVEAVHLIANIMFFFYLWHVRVDLLSRQFLLLPTLLSRPMSTEKKMNARKVIGTHDGKFHCDEVLACAMLKLLPVYKFAFY